jgi:hypothetical protein
MDMPIPIGLPGELDAFNQRLLARLEAAIPGQRGEPEHDTHWQDILQAFNAFDPRDAAESILAVIAIQAAEVAVENYARAARPDIPGADGLRLLGSALSAGRSFHSVMRTLRRVRPAPRTAAKPEPTPEPAAAPEVPEGHTVLAPGATPIPIVEMFQPHDRHGQPIPPWQRERMTTAQRKAALAMPRDPELEAAALADENRMQAEQAAADATPPPGPSG